MNGAGTGMVIAYQATRQMQARLWALTAVNAVVIGAAGLSVAAAFSTRGFSTGASASPRTSAATTMASALFATPTSVG